MNLPGRVGMTAKRGRLPHRWWCALRGHRWINREPWLRVKVAEGPWRLLKDPCPVIACDRCGAQQPWTSEFAETEFTLDQVLVR